MTSRSATATRFLATCGRCSIRCSSPSSTGSSSVSSLPVARQSEQPYLLWLLTGILPFQWTLHVLNDCRSTARRDAKLVTASSLPRETWVLRTVLSRFVEFFFTLPITAAAALLYRESRECWILLVPLAFLVQGIYNTGLGSDLLPRCVCSIQTCSA